jgi:hypothetical protein
MKARHGITAGYPLRYTYQSVMLESISDRGYLVSFKAACLPQQFTDVLVIGGGKTGLRSAMAGQFVYAAQDI